MSDVIVGAVLGSIITGMFGLLYIFIQRKKPKDLLGKGSNKKRLTYYLKDRKTVDDEDSWEELLSRYNRGVFSSMSNYNLLSTLGNNKFYNYIKEKYFPLEFIITDPNVAVFDDFIKTKVCWETHDSKKEEQLKTVDETLKKFCDALKYTNGYVTQAGQYHAIMILYKNLNDKADDDYMKIDLYNYFTTDAKRRVIRFERKDNSDWFEFFEEEYSKIKENAIKIEKHLLAKVC